MGEKEIKNGKIGEKRAESFCPKFYWFLSVFQQCLALGFCSQIHLQNYKNHLTKPITMGEKKEEENQKRQKCKNKRAARIQGRNSAQDGE